MKRQLSLVSVTTLTSVLIASSVVAPVLAWHPQAEITKSVQDVTSNSQTVSAMAAVNIYKKTDNQIASQVLTVAPGDTLKYIVVVKDPAPAASNKYDDFANAKIIDTLPQGVQQTNSTALEQAVNDIAPGQQKSYEYDVKVTDQTNAAILTNKACVTGSSANNDVTGLEACASVSVKVTVPPVPAPTPTPTPAPSPTPTQPTSLPNTGAGNAIFPIAGMTIAISYVIYLIRMKRKASA